MKKIINYMILGFCTMGFSSCEKFLMETSGDLLVPQSVVEFIPLLYGEGYPRTFNVDAAWIVLMTDDVEIGPFERPAAEGQMGFDLPNGGEGRRAFRWEEDMERNGLFDNFWAQRYRNILGCNTIISRLPHMIYTEAQTGLFHSLAAQAYTLRAYHYFALINVYALPWSPENLGMPGVVWRDSPEISTEPRRRSTIGEIYAHIEADLARAEEHMAKAQASANRHLIGPIALQLFKTRVALFQEKWDEVIRIGENFLIDNASILNLNLWREDEMGFESAAHPYIFDLNNNPEIVFTFGNAQGVRFLSPGLSVWSFGFRVSRAVPFGHPNHPAPNVPLLSLYTEDDLRRQAYFRRDIMEDDVVTRFHWSYPVKYKAASAGYAENWRTVEVYLNVAEAHARRANGVSQEAINLINMLRRNRIRTASFEEKTVGDFANKEELVKFIWDERRRELCFEEHHRWWDLRRQGTPRIEHREFVSNTTFEVYILPQGHPNYVLQIPRSETEFNEHIVGNRREHIPPQ